MAKRSHHTPKWSRRAFGILAALYLGWSPGSAALAQNQLAQAGSSGGSIGGSIDPAPPAAPAPASQPRPKVQRPARAPRDAERRAPPRRAGGGNFDGAWTVSAGGPCASAGTSQVIISGRNVINQGMVTGHVSAGGAVSTLASFNGMTVTGRGQIVGGSASGVYRQSDGCSGSWSAIKL